MREDTAHGDVGTCLDAAQFELCTKSISSEETRRGSQTIRLACHRVLHSWSTSFPCFHPFHPSRKSRKWHTGSRIDARWFPIPCILDLMDDRNQARTHLEIPDGSSLEDQDPSFHPFDPIDSNLDPYHSFVKGGLDVESKLSLAAGHEKGSRQSKAWALRPDGIMYSRCPEMSRIHPSRDPKRHP